ncbi:hypothetical protein [Acutalibacter intestini]|uniref:hypothetical protein n=1 Tax=Acutalibacter intestini TaxID=3093659 RepID=UPI002AC90224|nr:hypothetical protein [Acutalibacter sp. M00204]
MGEDAADSRPGSGLCPFSTTATIACTWAAKTWKPPGTGGGKANRSVGTMLSMPLDSAWLFARGEQARLTKKFDLYGHRRYHERRDCEKAGEKEKEAQLCPLPMIHSAPSAARP